MYQIVWNLNCQRMSKNLKKPPISQSNLTGESQSQQNILDRPLNSADRSKWSINIQEIVKRTQRNLKKGNTAPASQSTAVQKKSDPGQKPAGAVGLDTAKQSSASASYALYQKIEQRKPLGQQSTSVPRANDRITPNTDKRTSQDPKASDYQKELHQRLNLLLSDPSSITQNKVRPTSAKLQLKCQYTVQTQGSVTQSQNQPSLARAGQTSALARERENSIEAAGSKATSEMFYRKKAQVNDGSLQGAQGTSDLKEFPQTGVRKGYRTLEGGPISALVNDRDDMNLQEDSEAVILQGNGNLLSKQRQYSASGLNNHFLSTLAQETVPGQRSGSSLLINNFGQANVLAQSLEARSLAERQLALQERIRTQESVLQALPKTKYGLKIDSIAEEMATNHDENQNEIIDSLERQAANFTQISGRMEDIGQSTVQRDGKGLILGMENLNGLNNVEYFSPLDWNAAARATSGNMKLLGGGSLQEVEQRQRIFEEEIIKRVKEIQRYVKALHLQLKKTQSAHNKIREEMESDKDILLDLQKQIESQHQRNQQDKSKFVTVKDHEVRLKDLEELLSERMLQMITETVETTLVQVRDEIIPDSRLHMYDAINKETDQIKIDLVHDIDQLRNQLAKQEDAIRSQVDKQHQREAMTLRQEIKTEQNAQSLQIFSQLEGKIAGLVKQMQTSEGKSQSLTIKAELKKEMQQLLDDSESKAQERQKLSESFQADIEGKVRELQTSINTQLNKKLSALQGTFVSADQLNEKLAALKKSQSFITLQHFQDEVQELKQTWQEDIKLHSATTAKQLKQEAKKEMQQDHDKTIEKFKQDIQQTNAHLSRQQEATRELAERIDALHRANEILQNYNDLPELIESIQEEVNELKSRHSSKFDDDQFDAFTMQLDTVRQRLSLLEKASKSNQTNGEPTGSKVGKEQLDDLKAQFFTQVSQLKQQVETQLYRLDRLSDSTSSQDAAIKKLESKSKALESETRDLAQLQSTAVTMATVEDMAQEIKKLTTTLEESQEKIEDLESEYSYLVTTRQQVKEDRDEIQQMKEAIERLESKRILLLEKQIERIKQDYSHEKSAAQSQDSTTVSNADVLKREMQMELENLAKQISLNSKKFDQKIQQLETQHSDSITELQTLLKKQADLDKLNKTSIEKLSGEQRTHEQEVTRQAALIKSIENDVKRADTELKQALDVNTKDLKQSGETIKDVQTLIQDLESRLDAFQQLHETDINSLKQQMISMIRRGPGLPKAGMTRSERPMSERPQTEYMTEEYVEATAPQPVAGAQVEVVEVTNKLTEQEITRAVRPKSPEAESMMSFDAPSSFNRQASILSKEVFEAPEEVEEVEESVEKMMDGLNQRNKTSDQYKNLPVKRLVDNQVKEEQDEILEEQIDELQTSLQQEDKLLQSSQSKKSVVPQLDLQKAVVGHNANPIHIRTASLTASLTVNSDEPSVQEQQVLAPVAIPTQATHNQAEAQMKTNVVTKVEEKKQEHALSSQAQDHEPAAPEFVLNQSKSIKEGSQLFRTQTISGLAALGKQATQQFLNGDLDIEGNEEGGLQDYLDGLESQSKVESEIVMSGLKPVSDADSQEDGVSLPGVGNFLQKFEAHASKKTGLLNFDSKKQPQYLDEEELSEYAGKSNVDFILDSGNFCIEASLFKDLHNRNPSQVSDQFNDKFANIKINPKLLEMRNNHMLSYQSSQDQLLSECSNLPKASKAVLNMKLDGSVKSSNDNKSAFDLQSAQSLSYQNSQQELLEQIYDENDPQIDRIVRQLVEQEVLQALLFHADHRQIK